MAKPDTASNSSAAMLNFASQDCQPMRDSCTGLRRRSAGALVGLEFGSDIGNRTFHSALLREWTIAHHSMLSRATLDADQRLSVIQEKRDKRAIQAGER